MTKKYFNQLPADTRPDDVDYYKAVNWNNLEDLVDKLTYEKLTSQFWLSTRVPVSNDIDDWRTMTPMERDIVDKVLMGLTMLDTLQSEEGAVVLLPDARTQHEKSVLSNIHFMEAEHARSYSTIFSSLNNTARIDELFQWGNNNEMLQYKAKKINEIYQDGTPLQKKVASVFLESFLFYSGFYTPLRFLGSNKIPNVAEIIKLILRDESVHGTYLGYKFQLGFDELPKEEQEELKNWTYDLLFDLYDNESKYTHLIYDEIGWDADVLTFIRYNANKALQNLGFDPLFPDTAEDVNPIVMNGISTGTSNHDFFSQVGNGYLMGEVEAMDDSDYADWM